MGKVLSFGELLLRISPDVDGTWLHNNKLPFYIGGAECNVATALALWGIPTAYLTALPANFLSDQVVDYLQEKNIATDKIIYGGERIGLYYLHQGKDLKSAGVIYDRQHSAYANLKPGTINWDDIFAGVSWFHFSAICPAINQQVADVCAEALKIAAEKNIFVSLDLNYRAKLWQYGKDPGAVMPVLAQYCNLIMGNIWAADKMLGISLDAVLIANRDKESLLQQAAATSTAIQQQFPRCETVANTFRFDQGQGIKYYTTLYHQGELICSPEYHSDTIVDKIGSGDCFMAGLIYGFYQKMAPAETLEFATAAAFQKLFIQSDATTSTVTDIQNTITTYAHAH